MSRRPCTYTLETIMGAIGKVEQIFWFYSITVWIDFFPKVVGSDTASSLSTAMYKIDFLVT